MSLFGLRFDFDENKRPPYFDKEDQRHYSYLELELTDIEMKIVLRAVYSKKRTTGLAKRLLKFMSQVLGETPENILRSIEGYRLMGDCKERTRKGDRL